MAVFVALDIVAIGSAVLAAAGRRSRRALWAFLVCGCVALVSLVATTIVAAAGLGIADSAQGSGSDPSEQARGLAQGISVAMNGTALGLLSTFVTGLAAVVCLVAGILYRSRSTLDQSAKATVP